MGYFSKILDKAGDMFMPKELAPFASVFAPMLTGPIGNWAGLGTELGMGLGQLASAKMHSGKLDPYNALGVFMAGNTPQAKAARMRGRIDPRKGNLGQIMGGKIAGSGIFGGTDKVLNRAFDPRYSMAQQTYTMPAALSKTGKEFDYKSYYESPTMAEGMQLGKPNQPFPFEEVDLNPPSDYSDEVFRKDYNAKYGAPATAEYVEDPDGGFGLKKVGKGNLTPTEHKKYLKANAEGKGDAYIKTLGRRTMDAEGNITMGGDQGFLDSALEGISEKIFPGFSEIDPTTGKYVPGSFNFKKALITVGSATTFGTMMAVAEKLKREIIKDEKQQAEIWKKWFDGYEVTAKHPYSESPFPDPTLMKMYERFMMATGGRVGYNVGGDTGIIAAAPGMPQGTQLDGRDGMFISQGVEEKADDVPAMLSKNEFVLTADAMKGFDKMSGGNGDPRAAAQKMYQMMNQMEAMA